MSFAPASVAARYFSVVPYATLCTFSPQGPWATPVYFSTTPDLTVIWPSARDALHSRNIRVDGRVAFAFYDTNTPFGHAQGLFARGSAWEIQQDELAAACQAFYSRRFPDPEQLKEKARTPADFTDPSPRRLYSCRIEQAWVLDPNGHPEHGSLIDVRIEVPLEEFRTAYLPPVKPSERATV